MCEPTLVVLAAGMGSRYGGAKQVDPVGSHGQIIMDYSVFDAVRAGFKRVLFLIKPSMRENFEREHLERISRHVNADIALQEPERFLPDGFTVPEGRTKPWGTGHAVLCCRDKIDGAFAMINADDYYGVHAYAQMYSALKEADPAAFPPSFSMVGYRLGNTLTESGKVARGLCVTRGGYLDSIVERTYVVKTPDGAAYSPDGGKTLIPTPADSIASMNFWGFTPAIFGELAVRFPRFLETEVRENPNAEMYIPNVVGELLREGRCTVRVMESRDVWHGVTYREDKPDVVAAVAKMTAEGLYPERLWD